MSLSSSDNESLDSDSWEEEYHVQNVPAEVEVQTISDFVNLSWDVARNRGNFEMIRHLVEHDVTSINYQNSEGITLLMIAAADNADARGARLICESGAKTGICDEHGRMALHFAANSGNVELLQCVLQHTETNCIERWFMNIPNVLQASDILHSLVGCAIHSGNEKCLEILLSSDKLSKSILQAPFVKINYNIVEVYSPVAYVFSDLVRFNVEKLNSYLQLVLKHKMTMLDEFFRVLSIEWPHNPHSQVLFHNPFSKIFDLFRSFSKQQFYFNWLNENDVTIDYCLQCYHDNTQPFASFTDYKTYYKPVMKVLENNQIDALKLIMSETAILEPDELIVQFIATGARMPYSYRDSNNIVSISEKDMFKYLISLKPVYYKQVELCNRIDEDEFLVSWYPYSTIAKEFSKSTLQQLCRTTIRHHVRKYTLEDNLRNFRKSILQLPLPPAIKEFLLFKS